MQTLCAQLGLAQPESLDIDADAEHLEYIMTVLKTFVAQLVAAGIAPTVSDFVSWTPLERAVYIKTLCPDPIDTAHAKAKPLWP